jgi:hypothetical protein
MVATREYIPDAFVGVVEFVFEEIHRDLARDHVFFFTILREECADLDTEVSRDRLDQVLITTATTAQTTTRRDSRRERSDRELRQTESDIFQSWWGPLEIMFRDDLVEYSLDLSDIGCHVFSDEF